MSLNTSVTESLCLHNTSLTTNQTPCILEKDIQTEDGNQMYFLLNLFVIRGLLISTGCNLVALRVVLQCRKLPISIRYLSANFLIGFLMIGVSNMIHNIAMVIVGSTSHYYELIFNARLFFFCVFLSVLWCSMCALTGERYIAIVFPYNYVPLMRKSILYLTITIIWVFNIIVPSAFVIINLLKICGQGDYLSSCDVFVVFMPFRVFISSM